MSNAVTPEPRNAVTPYLLKDSGGTPTLGTGAPSFAEALALSRARKVELPEIYYGELIGHARQTAFSVAGLTSLTQIQGVLDSVNKNLAKGQSFEDWKTAVSTGTVSLDLPAWRYDTIFRTNLQSAYARGRYQQQQANTARRPYFMYSAIHDHRTRPNHMAMDGFIALHDDPIWATRRPPLGYRCRCTLISLTHAQAIARGYGGQTIPPLPPDPGWDYDKTDPDLGLQRAQAEATQSAPHALTDALAKRERSRPAPPRNLDTYLGRGKAHLAAVENLTLNLHGGELTSLTFRQSLARVMEMEVVATGGPMGYLRGPTAGKELLRTVTEQLIPRTWLKGLTAHAKANSDVLELVPVKDRAHYLAASPVGWATTPPTPAHSARLTYRDRESLTHELFHHLQVAFPDLDDFMQQLYQRRTAGEAAQKLGQLTPLDYREDEVARPDKFVDPYFGKVYDISTQPVGRAGALEMLTMSAQYLLGGDTEALLLLLKEDRQSAELLIGLLFHWHP